MLWQRFFGDKMSDWSCPCNGCKKARKQALKQVQDILFSDKDLMYTWSMAHEFIREELKK